MVNIKHQEMKIMKKIYLIAAAAIVSSAVACNKAEVGEPGKKDEGREVSAETPIKVNIRVSDLASDTKAVKSGWEDGDIIHLWLDNSVFDDYSNKFNRFSGNDFPLKYDKSKDEWTFQGDINEVLLKESGGFIRGFYESSNQLWTETDMAKQPEDDNVHENRALWGNLNVFNHLGHPYVWYDGPGRTGSRGRLGILTAVCNNIPYTYNKDTKVLTAKIDKWRFPTDFQLVVTGLDYERCKYTLYSDQIYSVQTIDVQHGEYPYDCWIADYEHDESAGPLLKAGSEGGNIAAVENPDGIAFVGKLRYPGEEKKYTFTLVEVAYTVAADGARVPDENNCKVYTLTIPQEMTLDSQNGSKLVAVKVPFSYFQYGWKRHPVSAATEKDLGKLVGQDGFLYSSSKEATEAGTTSVAMVAYVGSDTGDPIYNHGIAIALSDLTTGKPSTLEGVRVYYYKDLDNFTGWYEAECPAPENTSGWKLPSVNNFMHISESFNGTPYNPALDKNSETTIPCDVGTVRGARNATRDGTLRRYLRQLNADFEWTTNGVYARGGYWTCDPAPTRQRYWALRLWTDPVGVLDITSEYTSFGVRCVFAF